MSLIKPFTFTPKTTALANEMNATFDTIVAYINTNCSLKDGTNATPEVANKNIKAYVVFAPGVALTGFVSGVGKSVQMFTNVQLAANRYYAVDGFIPGVQWSGGSNFSSDLGFWVNGNPVSNIQTAVASTTPYYSYPLRFVFKQTTNTSTANFDFRLRQFSGSTLNLVTTLNAPPWFAIYDLGLAA